MDDSVHVKIETVKFRYPILCDELGDGWVSLAQPTEKLETESIYWTIYYKERRLTLGTPILSLL